MLELKHTPDGPCSGVTDIRVWVLHSLQDKHQSTAHTQHLSVSPNAQSLHVPDKRCCTAATCIAEKWGSVRLQLIIDSSMQRHLNASR
jgi:hypothetical protein